jgi:hypothetical protein
MGQELNITSYIAAQGVGGSCAMLGLHRETEAATAEIKTARRRIIQYLISPIAGLVLLACAGTGSRHDTGATQEAGREW